MFTKLTRRVSNPTLRKRFPDFPLETVLKVSECMDRKEPFGLDDPMGTWICLPLEGHVFYFDLNLRKGNVPFPTAEAFEEMVIKILKTHQNFNGPLKVHQFLQAVKILKDV